MQSYYFRTRINSNFQTPQPFKRSNSSISSNIQTFQTLQIHQTFKLVAYGLLTPPRGLAEGSEGVQ
jgi:hypothetical protein